MVPVDPSKLIIEAIKLANDAIRKQVQITEDWEDLLRLLKDAEATVAYVEALRVGHRAYLLEDQARWAKIDRHVANTWTKVKSVCDDIPENIRKGSQLDAMDRLKIFFTYMPRFEKKQKELQRCVTILNAETKHLESQPAPRNKRGKPLSTVSSTLPSLLREEEERDCFIG